MKVKILTSRDAAYDSAGAVVPMTAGTVVEVAEGEATAFWARMLLAGEAEQVPEAEPEAEPEAPKRRGRTPLPRDADGNIVRT